MKWSGYRTEKFQGKTKPSPMTRIIMSTMQTLRRSESADLLRRRLICNDTRLIIIDEAQVYGSKSYQHIEELFPLAKIVGLSASPYRGNKFSFNQFDKVSYSISLEELIDQGYLARPILNQIDLKGMDVPERIAHVAGVYTERMEGKGALVYWNTKVQAETASLAFNEAGIRSAYIHDSLSAGRKRRVLEMFDKGEINVIHNVNILSAGYDSTRVYGVFLPMGTSSPVMYIQRVGRGLRLEKGKQFCQVYLYGDAPSIARGLYKKIHKVAMRVKDDPEYGKEADIYETMDWLEAMENPAPEKIRYTMDVIDAHKRIKAMNLDTLADMIRFKKFPKRYLRSLMTGEAKIDEAAKGHATDRQVLLLESKGFTAPQIDCLNRRDAGALCSLIQSTLNKRWVVKGGLHENKFIGDIPGAYLGAIKKKNPNHPVLRMYRLWMREGKPLEN
jgi:superfamily II DNA or RNA helicase